MDLYKPILKKEIIGPIIVLICAIIFYEVIRRLIDKIFETKYERMDQRKLKTIQNLLKNILQGFVIVISLLVILEIYNINTKSLLASLGIVGVVLGLALQDLLKDILSGLSIILENQYAVGDIVMIGDFKGEVIQLGIRTTRVKSATGEVKVIANRNITEIINYSMEDSKVIVEVPVAYKEDAKKVQKVLDNLCKKLEKNELIKEEVCCTGMTLFDNSSVRFRIVAKIEAGLKNKFEVQDLILKEVKEVFEKENIEIPFEQVVVHHGV